MSSLAYFIYKTKCLRCTKICRIDYKLSKLLFSAVSSFAGTIQYVSYVQVPRTLNQLCLYTSCYMLFVLRITVV